MNVQLTMFSYLLEVLYSLFLAHLASHNDKYHTLVKYKSKTYRIGIWQGKRLSSKMDHHCLV